MKIDRFKVLTETDEIKITLEKRGKSAHITCRFSIHGKQIERSTKTNNIQLARIKAKQIANDLSSHAQSTGTLAMHSAIDWYLETEWPNKIDHAKKYHQILTDFKTNTENLDLTTCGATKATEIIQNYLDQRALKKSIQSINTLHRDQRHISAFFGWINKRKKLWIHNPALKQYLTLKPAKTSADKPIEIEVLNKFLIRAEDYEIFPTILLCLNGLRAKGAVKIKWQDIDFKRGLVKTLEKRVERFVPLSPYVQAKLEAFRPKPATGPLWPYNYYTAHDELKLIREEYSLPDSLTFNRIRATGEWMMYEQGVPPQKAAKMLGHTVQTATRHYINLESLSAHDAAAKIDPTSYIKNKTSRGKSRGKKNKKIS